MPAEQSPKEVYYHSLSTIVRKIVSPETIHFIPRKREAAVSSNHFGVLFC